MVGPSNKAKTERDFSGTISSKLISNYKTMQNGSFHFSSQYRKCYAVLAILWRKNDALKN